MTIVHIRNEVDKEFWKQFDCTKVLYYNELPRRKRYLEKVKKIVLTHYGGGELACVKCGCEDIRALSIDHIYGGGAEHRRSRSGSNLYLRLRRDGYPEGYQTLCMNCQFVKRVENNEMRRCP